jgi:hypothetical protein
MHQCPYFPGRLFVIFATSVVVNVHHSAIIGQDLI